MDALRPLSIAATPPGTSCYPPAALRRLVIIDARAAGKRYDLVVGGMLLIGLAGLTIDAAFRLLISEKNRA